MLTGKPLTEEEIDGICEKLREAEWRDFIRTIEKLEDELSKYRRKYGPLPGPAGTGKTTKVKGEIANEK